MVTNAPVKNDNGGDDFNSEAWAELRQLFEPAGIAELVTALAADLPEQQQRHAAASERWDMAALRRVIHALHGASLQLGADALAELCEQAERAAAAGEQAAALRQSAGVMLRYAALVERLRHETGHR